MNQNDTNNKQHQQDVINPVSSAENKDKHNVNHEVNNGHRDVMTGYEDYLEETAQEMYAPISDYNKESNKDDKTTGSVIGFIALALAIISLFNAPVLFGAGGIILGFIARARGATGLGSWAIGLGILSVVVGLFIAPFF